MSKIYDALQIAYGERHVDENGSTEASTISSPPLLKIDSPFSIARYYKDPELLGLAQHIATRLADPKKNVIQFIGTQKGEGTSTLAREFAMVLAQHSTKPILLVEADLIQPCQYQAFGVDPKPPLENHYENGKSLDGVISQIEDSNLYIGTLSPKVQSALTGQTESNGKSMWDGFRNQFALIVIDSSPARVTPDSLALCGTVDGIIFVLQAEKTRSTVARSVKEQILMRGGNILGLVLTKLKFHIPERIYKLL
ncbi:CpsD/CapB family tyrosine-protein kinase [Nitrospira sp. M1]